ncbi:lipopolysaccharide heptosyltransferase II [Deinococcus hopiensis]|uniref:lipopolysaccharide heptosyltransferase II n=1 Tax=Deinococcus hopiensis KR-140 TaxID=695939 RepID=A0A1W1UGY4_9DEIO|nr:lipopolysaccharide heptosyltransferase II [Deinococcus hopiensis]SMB80330.1 lipopolysaccharide heptosyltransferase II [Deinococcus hopiensis KR-140]
MPGGTDAWAQARNILAVRLDTLGDVLMTTPAIRALKAGHPERQVTLLTSAPGAAVARLVPEIDDVLVYPAPWLKATAPRKSSAPDFEMIAGLRARGFDAAVIFTVYSQNPLPSAMLCFLADIPLRLAHCRENPYQLLTDWVRETEPEGGIRHEVQRQLDLVALVGLFTPDERMSLSFSYEAGARVTARLEALGLGPLPSPIVIHPGATAASRRYPPESFAEVAGELSARGFPLLFTGDGGEQELIARIREMAGGVGHSLAGELSLEELAALIARSPLLISNNTGPAHMAAALGTPVVDLYALTNPQHTPWAVPSRVLSHDVPCRWCYSSVCRTGHHLCLRGVTPGEVVSAALELLTPAPLELA